MDGTLNTHNKSGEVEAEFNFAVCQEELFSGDTATGCLTLPFVGAGGRERGQLRHCIAEIPRRKGSD